MKKIKLMVDAHVFDEGFQGTATFIKGIYGELIKRPELEIYLAARNIENLKEIFGDGNFGFLQLKSSSRFKRLAFEIPALIRENEIDFAHFQYVAPPVKNCKFIVTIHDLLFKKYPKEFPLSYRLQKNFLFKASAKKADILTTVSNYSAGQIASFYKIPIEKIVLTPNAVGAEFFEQHDKEVSKQLIMAKYGIENFILYVSRIEPRKNHVLLLNAFHQLGITAKNYHLVFIGAKSMASKRIENILAKINAAQKPNISWLEKVEPHELLHFYRAAKLFVYPSLAEGFGIPPLEAAAAGTPVLCSNTTAMSDFDFFGNDFFDPLDESFFLDKLKDRLHHADSNSYLSNLSRIVKERYSWATAADALFAEIVKLSKL